MKRLICTVLIIVFIITVPIAIYAREVTIEDVQQVAEKFLVMKNAHRAKSLQKPISLSVADIQQLQFFESDEILAYIVGICEPSEQVGQIWCLN